MYQISQHNPGKKKTNIVLVGVSGVGKTTLGEIAAEQLNMAFVDVDMGLLEAEETDVDAMLNQYGADRFDQKLLYYFITQVRSKDHTIIAASSRIFKINVFWSIAKQDGILVHLQGKPLDVYRRISMWWNGRLLTPEDKADERWRLKFDDYYKSMLQKCKKADHTVRVVGDKQIDADNLTKTIKLLLSVDDTNDEEVSG